MNSNAAYTKAHFYQLVKLYHPDLTSSSSVAHQLKMERYRLIVAAHTILSDPVKRSAYDRFGAGWNGKAEVDAQGNAAHPGPGPFSHSWQGQGQANDPIWNNATWEDWERFYAWRARKNGDEKGVADDYPQAPLYMRNSYFVVAIVIFAFFGGSANYNRAQDAGSYFVEQRDLVHDQASKELRK
ncbi:J domain-containing protein 1, partial [Teratosphaeriaceae sp. CCFEE 6253]